MSFHVQVDVMNPGQFFACCGLFELAARLDRETTAQFDGGRFVVAGSPSLERILIALTNAPVRRIQDEKDSAPEDEDEDEDDASKAGEKEDKAPPLYIGAPFEVSLDWWLDRASGGSELKVWAGSMNCFRIYSAMVCALREPALQDEHLFDTARVVFDPWKPKNKVEPFYFDARRASNAHSRDVGFAINDLKLPTMAFPAVEALCLVGLQRCRPAAAADRRRVFKYRTWSTPLPISVVAPVISGAVPMVGTHAYRFESWFRTGQRKHKVFRPAVLLGERE